MAYIIFSFIIAGAGGFIVWRYGFTLGLADMPNERSAHKTPVPKGGGAGIAVAFTLVSLLYSLPLGFVLPLAVISIMGISADRSDWNPKLRLAFMLFCTYLASVLLVGLWWAVPAALLLAATANFYNFMDGIDGMAALCGLGAFGLLALLAQQTGSQEHSGLALCAAGACAGFLPFNYPKARVFMGDVGSLTLGFAFAWLALAVSHGLADLLCALSFLWLFYADELFTMCMRLKNRENLLKAHRRHMYQLLANELKTPHYKVSAAYAIVQLVTGLAALTLRPHGIGALIPLLTLCAVAFVFVYTQVWRLANK
ncbi:MAG: hypothetical protein WCS77_08340 [Elusimicrobiaceae bacterium]